MKSSQDWIKLTISLNSILETHHKNIIILGGFTLSVAGWWLWQIILSRMYGYVFDIYLVRDNFLLHYGQQLSWWAICLLELAALVVLDLVTLSIRRVYFPTDQDLMQRIEKDAKSKKAMKDHAARMENGDVDAMEMQDVPAAKPNPDPYYEDQDRSGYYPQQPYSNHNNNNNNNTHTAAAPPPRPTRLEEVSTGGHMPGRDYSPAEYSQGPESPAFDRPVSVRDFPVAERPVPGRNDSEAWTGTASYYYSRVDPHRSNR